MYKMAHWMTQKHISNCINNTRNRMQTRVWQVLCGVFGLILLVQLYSGPQVEKQNTVSRIARCIFTLIYLVSIHEYYFPLLIRTNISLVFWLWLFISAEKNSDCSSSDSKFKSNINCPAYQIYNEAGGSLAEVTLKDFPIIEVISNSFSFQRMYSKHALGIHINGLPSCYSLLLATDSLACSEWNRLRDFR